MSPAKRDPRIDAYIGKSAPFAQPILEWITDAKTGATRARRLVQAIAWMAEGKSRNWKYQK